MKLALVEIPRHAMRLEDYARQLGVHSGDERRTRRGIPQDNARTALGVDDQQRAATALRGIKGKRLTYRTGGWA